MTDKLNELKDKVFRLQTGGTCVKCNENLCKCPERQVDGSWKENITIEDIIKESEESFRENWPQIKLPNKEESKINIERLRQEIFLSQSIRQAVETAFKAIEVEKIKTFESEDDVDFTNSGDVRSLGFQEGSNNTIDEIESLKKKFLNK